MYASDGKMRKTDCANIEQVFRIIQSIPSKKVEPLKRWLALVGKERLDEIADPEKAMGRANDGKVYNIDHYNPPVDIGKE